MLFRSLNNFRNEDTAGFFAIKNCINKAYKIKNVNQKKKSFVSIKKFSFLHMQRNVLDDQTEQ